MDFASAAIQESRHTLTENGATAYNTTGNALLDFYATVGSLRNAEPLRIERLFADAYAQSPLLATRCLFYSRDIREGLGERKTFRLLLRYAATHHPEAITRNIQLIGLYGRYDDLYTLIGTPLEKAMWTYMRAQFLMDIEAMKKGKPCSLLAKWIKTPDASSPETRRLGILTAKSLGYKVYDFKRLLRALRKHLDIIEVKMSSNDWGSINYASVPSRAMSLYRNAFSKHDETRFKKFIEKVNKGEAKIHAATLYPYDLLAKYKDLIGCRFGYNHRPQLAEDPVVEAQWKALPNYVEGNFNAVVIADTSGSMTYGDGMPIRSAVGLAVYFAERNTGPYHGLWMSFSSDSKMQRLKGETLAQKLANIDTEHWANSTNLERAFMHILGIAISNHVPPEQMPKSLIVISDMEINRTVGAWSFYDEMRKRFAQNGYEIPNVVYWNVNSRNDVFHADADRKGVQLCSGQSTSTFKTLMDSVGNTPTEMMLKVLNSERYAPVTIKA